MIRRLVMASKDPRDVVAADVDLTVLLREFPTLEIEARSLPPDLPSRIDADEWRDPDADLAVLDERLGRGGDGVLGVVATRGSLEETALQVLTRYQGLVDRRNEASATPLFDRVREQRLALEDAGDGAAARSASSAWSLALDVWQWTLRLAPGASLALQLAALFRDAALPVAEPERGAPPASTCLRKLLAKAAVPTPTAGRACGLLLRHPDLIGHPELAVLEEASALSFFSQRADGALRRLGAPAARAAIRLALHRLRPAARVRLLHIRLVPEVWRMVEEALRSEKPC